MHLNLNDPSSIVAWWKVFPEQHQNYLDFKLKASPEFGPAILEALRRIEGDVSLRSLLGRRPHEVRRVGTYPAEDDAGVAANEMLRGELAVA